MEQGVVINDDGSLKRMLSQYKTIAVIGLSPKPERDSYRVAAYLKKEGYKIIPIRPGVKEILGEKAYPSLDEVDKPVDIVNVFRKSEQIMPHVEEALRVKPNVFWMQLGIEHRTGADRLTKSGIDVVMDKCIKVEHGRLRPFESV